MPKKEDKIRNTSCQENQIENPSCASPVGESKIDEQISQLNAESEKIEEAALLRKIYNLRPKRKATILQCFEAANRKSPKGMRYSSEWFLECVIMRMKSASLYEHVRKEKKSHASQPHLPEEFHEEV
ncbi:hypothetical protein HPB48_005769 [Haemaphysalis longicornis]|uniref:Uncharacterized protein n=1 Tax=Haemaphysalis longicornis TaxID=44386 RepID=A0A9J6FB10_HAELO|nr:hypothetical protein HPB48_005769 [Haemaphysalis longicornis]